MGRARGLRFIEAVSNFFSCVYFFSVFGYFRFMLRVPGVLEKKKKPIKMRFYNNKRLSLHDSFTVEFKSFDMAKFVE